MRKYTEQFFPGKLVRFHSQSGLECHGFLWGDVKSDTCVIHVHGSYGNFYQASFLPTFARTYAEAGLSLCSINVECRDGFGEGYFRDGSFRYIGGAVSKFETCISDIGGAIEFIAKSFRSVIIQGHSLGCDRVLAYSLQNPTSYPIILLAPCDSHELQRKWLSGEPPEEQVFRIKGQGGRSDWLASEEYGINCGTDWTYLLPIQRDAFLSISDGLPFRLFNLKLDQAYMVNSSCCIYLGKTDPLRTFEISEFEGFFRARSKSLKLIVGNGGHMIEGCERLVARRIAKWIVDL